MKWLKQLSMYRTEQFSLLCLNFYILTDWSNPWSTYATAPANTDPLFRSEHMLPFCDITCDRQMNCWRTQCRVVGSTCKNCKTFCHSDEKLIICILFLCCHRTAVPRKLSLIATINIYKGLSGTLQLSNEYHLNSRTCTSFSPSPIKP